MTDEISTNSAFVVEYATKKQKYVLRLFLSGTSTSLPLNLQEINSLCMNRMRFNTELEILKIYICPEPVKDEHIADSKVLLSELPDPLRRVVWDLSERGSLLLGMEFVSRKNRSDLEVQSKSNL